MSILVSVIIPVFNGADHLPTLFASLSQQKYSHAEYIVVDNGSTDTSSKIIHAAARSSAAQVIKVVSESSIQSSYAARNAGIKAAKGSVLAFTDADCCPAPDWLQHLVQPFSDANTGIVVGSIHSLGGESIVERFSAANRLLSQEFTLQNKYQPYGQTANLAVRREVFDDIGLFRPHLTTGGDADICWRSTLNTAWRLAYQTDAIVYHRHRKTIDGLYKQFFRYGCAERYLSQLYQFPACGKLSPVTARRTARWLIKELLPDLVRPRQSRHKLFNEPLHMLCSLAFSAGYKSARLSEEQLPFEYVSAQRGNTATLVCK